MSKNTQILDSPMTGIINDIPRSETGKVGFETFYLESGIVWKGGIMNWGLGAYIAPAEKLCGIKEYLNQNCGI